MFLCERTFIQRCPRLWGVGGQFVTWAAVLWAPAGGRWGGHASMLPAASSRSASAHASLLLVSSTCRWLERITHPTYLRQYDVLQKHKHTKLSPYLTLNKGSCRGTGQDCVWLRGFLVDWSTKIEFFSTNPHHVSNPVLQSADKVRNFCFPCVLGWENKAAGRLFSTDCTYNNLRTLYSWAVRDN